MARLRAQDKQLLTDLLWEGSLSGDPVEVSHFFSFPLNRDGCSAAAAELQSAGYTVWAGEESSGDDYWHICAKRLESLKAAAVATRRTHLEALAARHGGAYDDWDLTRQNRTREAWQVRLALHALRAPEDQSAEQRAAAGLPVTHSANKR